jgi:hypothetical protein
VVSGSSGEDFACGEYNMVLSLTDDQRWDSIAAMPAVADVLAGKRQPFEGPTRTLLTVILPRVGA